MARSPGKKRWWSVKVKPEDFRSLGGEEQMSGYQPGQERGHTGFCKQCGVIPYGWVAKTEWNDAEYVSVNVAALDDLDPAELVAGARAVLRRPQQQLVGAGCHAVASLKIRA
jgi:hypothetical protein